MDIKSIKNKISLWAGLCVLVTSLSIALYSTVFMRGKILDAARNENISLAQAIVSAVETRLNGVFTASGTMAQTFSAVKNKGVLLDCDRAMVLSIIRNELENNSNIAGVFTCWEPNAFDGKDNDFVNKAGHDETGRFGVYLQRNNKGDVALSSIFTDPVLAPNGKPGKWYNVPRETLKGFVTEPFLKNMQGEKVLVTTMVSPIIAHGEFFGVMAMQMKLNGLQQIADIVEKKQQAVKVKISVISHDGILAGVTGAPELVGRHLKELHEDYEEDLATLKKLGRL